MPTRKMTTPIASSSSTTSAPATAPVMAPAVMPAVSPPPVPPPSPTPSPSPTPALEAYVQQAVASLDAAESGLGADPALSPGDKRHAAKFRKGGSKTVVQIGNLARQHQLESPALQVAVMLAMLGKADALQALADRLAAFTKHVTDVIFSAQSGAWVMALQYYAILQRRAKLDGELAAALQPITEFLAYRHPSAKKPVGSPTKAQVKAIAKATRTLKTVAGGKLGPAASPTPAAPAPAAAPSPQPAAGGNGAPPNGGPTTTNGGATPAAHS